MTCSQSTLRDLKAPCIATGETVDSDSAKMQMNVSTKLLHGNVSKSTVMSMLESSCSANSKWSLKQKQVTKLRSQVVIYSKINMECLLYIRYSAQSNTNGLKAINVALDLMEPVSCNR